MDLTIIKIGGSVITHKKSKKPKINFKNLKIVAQQLENFNKPYILIHGAGSYGHPLVQQSRIHQGITNRRQLIAFAQTQRQQNLLNTFVCEELIKRKIPAFPTQVSSNAVMSKGRLIQMNTTAIIGLLKIGIVPVCYGVPAYDQQKNDCLFFLEIKLHLILQKIKCHPDY